MKKLTAKAFGILMSVPLICLALGLNGGPVMWLSIASMLWVFTVFFIFQARNCDAKSKPTWVALAVVMIPISTVALGNAMVPLFFVGHAAMHGGGSHEIHGVTITNEHVNTRLDLLTQVQRPLYVSAYTDQERFELHPGQKRQVRLYVVNHQKREVNIVFKEVGVPMNADHYIMISNLPKQMKLKPGEGTDILLDIQMKDAVPKLFNHAIMQIVLMDKSIVGSLGKQKYWEKMKMPAQQMLKRMQNE